jgi:hypothetical protein
MYIYIAKSRQRKGSSLRGLEAVEGIQLDTPCKAARDTERARKGRATGAQQALATSHKQQATRHSRLEPPAERHYDPPAERHYEPQAERHWLGSRLRVEPQEATSDKQRKSEGSTAGCEPQAEGHYYHSTKIHERTCIARTHAVRRHHTHTDTCTCTYTHTHTHTASHFSNTSKRVCVSSCFFFHHLNFSPSATSRRG